MRQQVEEGTATQEETPQVHNRGKSGVKFSVLKHIKATKPNPRERSSIVGIYASIVEARDFASFSPEA